MLAYIEGTIKSIFKDAVIIVNHGLGYRIFMTTMDLTQLRSGQEAALYLHHHITEQGQRLYGFCSIDALEMFTLLLDISGIGPKSALNILSKAKIDDLVQCVTSQDAELLHQTTGLGKKTAEKVILGLKDSLKDYPVAQTRVPQPSQIVSAEAAEVLLSLGYTQAEARAALAEIDQQLRTVEQQLAAALKILGR